MPILEAFFFSFFSLFASWNIQLHNQVIIPLIPNTIVDSPFEVAWSCLQPWLEFQTFEVTMF